MKYLAFLLICLIAACSTNKTTPKSETAKPGVMTNSSIKDLLLTVKRQACHGRCPIYDISIYQNGQIEYEGIRFTEMLGPHTNKLNEQQLTHLKNTVAGIDWKSHPDKFPYLIADLPGTTLINHSSDPEKSIWWNSDAPQDLIDLRDLTATYLDLPNWVVNKKTVLPQNAISNELLIKFHKDVDVNEFVKNYNHFGLSIKEQLIPKMPIWLLTYDESKIAPYEMLNLMSKSEKVETAEFNKKVAPRKQ